MRGDETSQTLVGLDIALTVLLSMAALSIWTLLLFQEAGPYGQVVWPAVLGVGLAVPLLLVRVGLATVYTAPGRSLRMVVVTGVFLGAGIVGMPIRQQLVEGSARWEERGMVRRLEKAARECARSELWRYHEMLGFAKESARGAYGMQVADCMQGIRFDWGASCTDISLASSFSCAFRPSDPRDPRFIVVVLDGYLDEALRATGAAPWATGGSSTLPRRPWVRPGP
jgi:hypothetical protein